jgi:threonylcarbamoyladenosine tRNA methylthiotransferase MtaB
VDAGTLNRRSAQARRIGEDKRRQYHERHLGNVLEVLFEAQVSGRWHGYTGNYIRVAVCSSECLENALHPVRLETDCGEVVLGRLEG